MRSKNGEKKERTIYSEIIFDQRVVKRKRGKYIRSKSGEKKREENICDQIKGWCTMVHRANAITSERMFSALKEARLK